MTTTTPTIREDVGSDDGALTPDEAVKALLDTWDADEDQPSDKDRGADTTDEDDETDLDGDEDTDEDDESDDEDSEDDESDDETDEDEDEDEDDDPAPTKAGDDALVEIVIDGKTETVAVKDLKRLYGQEASLTRKSQEVAQARREADELNQQHTAALNTLFERAAARWKQYEDIDFMVAQTKLEPDEFAALREEARDAYNEYAYFVEEVKTHNKRAEDARIQALREAAKEARPVLERDIPGWNSELYADIRRYAVEQGLDAQEVNQVVNPVVIKLLYKAMQHDRVKQVATKKKAKAPKKVLKSNSKSANINKVRPEKAKALERRLAETGDKHAAVDLLMSRWSQGDEA